MIFGVLVSSLTALAFNMNRSAFNNGIYGYNGVVVGLSVAVYSFGNDDSYYLMPHVIVPIFLMSVLSTFVVAGLGSFLVGKFGVSPLTFPFCVCTWVWVTAAGP